jgi:hypothetical protein
LERNTGFITASVLAAAEISTRSSTPINDLNSWFVGGSREDYKEKPDHGHPGTVIHHHEVVAGIGEKTEAVSHKAQSRDQSENSDGSQ